MSSCLGVRICLSICELIVCVSPCVCVCVLQAVVAGNLPVDLMLKTKLGQRTVSRAPGLHVAINSLTQPLLAHAHDPSPGVAHMHATYTAPRL